MENTEENKLKAVKEAIKILGKKETKITSKQISKYINKTYPLLKITDDTIIRNRKFGTLLKEYNDKFSLWFKCISKIKKINIDVEIVEELPRINTRDVILVKKQYENDLEKLKIEFISIFKNLQQIKINRSSHNQSTFNRFETTLKRKELDSYNSLFAFIKEETTCSQIREFSMLRFASFIKFFLYWLKDKGVLLWSVKPEQYINILSQSDYVDEFFTSDVGKKLFEYKTKNQHFQIRPNIEIFLYTSITNINDFTEDDMQIIDAIVMDSFKNEKEKGVKKFGSFRKFIAFYNSNIDTLFTYRKKKRDVNKKSVFEVDFIAKHNHKEFELLIEDIVRYLKKKEKIDKVGLATIKEKKVTLMKFLDYCNNKKLFKYNIEALTEYFDYPDKTHTFQEIVISNEAYSNELKGNIINTTFEFIHASKKGVAFPKINVPKITRTPTELKRKVLDDEVYDIIFDMLLKSPPKSNYTWYKTRTDISWWEHDTYPILPLLVYFQLLMPVRGSQARNIDRDSLIIKESNNRIKGFYINTDKNKDRKTKFIIPNLWENEVKIFDNLVEWHKNYFPNAKPYRYKDENNVVHKDFIPLFMARNETTPIQAYAHMNYWKRVLCYAQIVLNQKYGINNPHSLVEMKNEKPFFKNIDEIDGVDEKYIFENVVANHDIHSLRKTGATRYIKMGLPIKLVQKLTGHSGVNTLLNIYVDLDEAKVISQLKEKSFFMGATKNDSLKNELLVSLKTEENISLEVFKKYGLFFFERNETETNKDIFNPLEWKVMNYGLCTSSQCPIGVENKCSLCPYFATSIDFIESIAMQIELKLMKTTWAANNIAENRKKGLNSENSNLRQSLKATTEEFMGWLDVLDTIQERTLEIASNNTNLPVCIDKEKYISNLINYSIVNEYEEYAALYAKMKNQHYEDNETSFMKDKLSNHILKQVVENGMHPDIATILNNQDKLIEWYIQKQLTITQANTKQIESF